MNRFSASICACLLASIAIADDRPITPHDLGDIGYGAHSVHQVSETGEMVGSSFPFLGSSEIPFYWSQQTGMINLGSIYGGGSARFITDDGVVVGVENGVSNWSGFYWTPEDGKASIPNPYGWYQRVGGVNNRSGMVFGRNCNGPFNDFPRCSGDYKGFAWTKTGGVVDLGASCTPSDINDADQVIGSCSGTGFIWTAQQGKQDIIIDGQSSCYPEAINNAGQVTGYCTNGPGFVWTENDGAITFDYPGLPPGSTTAAHVINDAGLVVGVAEGFPFMWTQAGGVVPIAPPVPGNLLNVGLDSGRNYGLSESGHIFFQANSSDPFTGAVTPYVYVWHEDTGYEELGAGSQKPTIQHWNDHGVAVGYQFPVPGNAITYLWSPDVGAKLAECPVVGLECTGKTINNRGQIGGTGKINQGAANNMLWNSEPMSYGLPPVALGDLNENGSMDLAVAMREGIDVHIRDSETQELISDLSFGNDPAIAIARIPDVNGNGADEVAMLGIRPSGQVRVQVKDGSTGALLKAIFYGTSFSAIDMAILPDSDGNGAPEVVVLGKNTIGAVRAQARDVLTSVATTTTYFGTTVEPVSVEILTDTSGNAEPEIAMLGTVIASGQRRLQLRDSSDNSFVRNVYFGTTYEPLQVLEIGDISGDGVPDIAQLGRDPATGGVRIQTKSTVSGATIFNAYTGAVDWPISIAVAKDRNADMIDEIALLTQKPNGVARINIRDGATGDFAGNILLGAITQPLGMVTIDDLNNSGDPEFAVLGEDINIVQIQVKDVVSGGQVGNIIY